MEKLVLIDGNSLINRAFYAMPVLSTKDGTYTNAVYGFMNMFFKMLSDLRPTYVGVAFDLKAPTFRHKLYSEYKGTRKPMPEELRPQIPLLKELLNLMGVKTFEKEGSEADDIIGTIAKATSVQTMIFTGDKDSFQLVDAETEVHFTKRGITDVEIYTVDNFKEKTSLLPCQIIDLKALMGDSSDNIPGIAGIGEKTAKSLLEEYGTVENVLANTDKFKGKMQEKLVNGKEIAMLSKKLATIDCDCGVDTDLTKMTVKLPFSADVRKRFVELEFKSLFKKDDWFESLSEQEKTTFPTPKAPAIIKEITSLDGFTIPSCPRLAFAIFPESVNLSDGATEYVIKTKQTLFDDGVNLSDALNTLKGFLTGNAPLVFFNKKELKHLLKNTVGIDLTAPCDDVAIIKYLADFTGKDDGLKDVIMEYLMPENAPASALLELYTTLYEKLVSDNMLDLYKSVELPLSDILFDMEVAGFKVDYDALNQASEKYRVIITDLEKQIRELADAPTLNVNSPKQLGEVLFEKLCIAKGKKTKSGYSTTAEILESLETAHPIIPLILKYRQIQKLQSTYVEGFKPLIDKKTGLIHTTFNQTLTATGRLSSKEPNLQNIPVRDDEGRELRKFFVPKGENRILVGADYSQIELRLLAAFSGCSGLVDAFKSGKDIHTATASKVFNVPLSQVTATMRSSAKAVNFGIIYGISEYGLAKQLKISNAEARGFIDAYFKEYPEVKQYMDANVASAKELGYATTMFGRKRVIRELSSSNYNIRQFGERVAMNMPLQGSSADIIKIAMIGVSKRIKEENLKSELILQVHDELIVDTLIDEKERVEQILVQEMQNAVKLAVDLTVSLGSGKSWFEAK